MNNNSKFSNIKVLVLDGSGRQMWPVLKGLHDLGCIITTINCSKLDIGYASRFPHKKLLVEVSSEEELVKIIEKEIFSDNYDVVIPLSDIHTDLLTKNWDRYKEHVKSFIPDYKTFTKAYDKQKTMEICQRIGVPCTRTKELNEDMEKFMSVVGGYPIVIKPRSACGSMGFHCIKSFEEYETLFNNKDIKFEDYLIQEYVPQNGNQYNVHLFMDDNNTLSWAVPTRKCRWFPVDGGSSCFCMTIDRPDLVQQCEKLLKEIKWRGYCEIELIEDPRSGIAKIMEINGRTSACVKICQLFGINIAQSMVELAMDAPVTKQMIQYHDVRMRCIHTDLLWLLKSPERFNTKPNWFSIRHTHDQIFAATDPWPFFTFSWQSVKRYKTEMKKRSR